MKMQKQFNAVGIQLIPTQWQSKLFKQTYRPYIDKLAELSKSHLQMHLPNRSTMESPIPEIKIPKLLGNTLTDHFYNLGNNYMKGITPLIEKMIHSIEFEMPKEWSTQPGWTKYDSNPVSVPFPTEDVYIFDTEVLVPLSKYPVLAVARSDQCWYSWCAPWLFYNANEVVERIKSLEMESLLIPFGSKDKLFIGHNIAYDRARILEEYTTNTNNNFMDTLSMHITVCGLSSQQRPAFMLQKKLMDNPLELKEDYSNWNEIQPDKWVQETSTNSLLEVAKFHCDIELNKSTRDIFVKGTLDQVQLDIQSLFNYCAQDVFATYKVFKVLYPKYLLKCPHPVSQAGPLMMIKSRLPISNRWDEFVKINEDKTLLLTKSIQEALIGNALKAIDTIMDRGPLLDASITENMTSATSLNLEHHEYCSVNVEKLKQHPHLCFLDWRIPLSKVTKAGVPVKSQKLRNYPIWMHSLVTCNQFNITFKQRQSVYLLNTLYHDQFVYNHPDHGFGLLTDDPVILKQFSHCTTSIYKHARVNYKNKNPLSYSSQFVDPTSLNSSDVDAIELDLIAQFKNKTFIRLSTDETIMGIFFSKSLAKQHKNLQVNHPECLENILTLASNAAYWMAVRKRVESQFIVPFRQNLHPKHKGLLLPLVIPSGTVTRRSVEPTWVTAANVKKGRFGSDLKMQVEAFEHYKIIGADVDSEELWIASLLGDAQFQMHGSTSIGFMTLQGNKKDQTDMHSVTANLVKISRDEAKGFNYARIYGSGEKHAAKTLELGQQISKEASELKAKQLFQGTKGNKMELTYVPTLPSKVWSGGTESFMFNVLENAADLKEPCTPVLRAVIPDSLLPRNVDKEFATTRVNWIVQASGVDYLHLLMILMEFFIKQTAIDCTFMISVHDELRYMCHDKDIYTASLVLQLSNLLTRAFFSERIGVHSLPLSCAFFSAIDIDTVLRKEPSIESETFPEIPKGTSLTIYELLDKLQHKWPRFKSIHPSDISSTCIDTVEPYVDKVLPFINKSVETHLMWLQLQETNDKSKFFAHGRALRQLMKPKPVKKEKQIIGIFKK